MLTIGDLLSFHQLDHRMYRKLVDLGNPLTTARHVVALWMYLQCMGIDVLGYLSDCRNDTVIRRFAAEGKLIVDHCIGNRSVSGSGVPYTGSLSTEELNFRFFRFNKDVVRRGVDYVLSGIGEYIFDEEVGDLTRPYYGRVSLNYDDRRTVFVTVSDGNRLDMTNILRFLQRKFGNCVEKMMVEETSRGVEPTYGRLVLSSESLMPQIFKYNEQLVAMDISGTQVWARMVNPMFD